MIKTYDVAVIGAGILGVCVAAELVDSGASVVLIESETAGCKASGNGFAWVNASSKRTDREYYNLNARGVSAYRNWAVRYGAGAIGWHPSGTFYWRREVETELATAFADELSSVDCAYELLNAEQLRRNEPNAVCGPKDCAILIASEGWLDVPVLIEWKLHEFLRKDGRYLPYTRVASIRRNGDASLVLGIPGNGAVESNNVVIASGISSPELCKLASPDYQLPLLDAPGVLMEIDGLKPIASVLYPPDEAGLHMRMTPTGRVLVGSDDLDVRFAAGCTHAQLEEALRGVAARAARATGAVADSLTWTYRICRRPMPLDGHPVAGWLSGAKGCYLLVSHSGVTLAPILAELAAHEILFGRDMTELKNNRPARFAGSQGEVRSTDC